jgi:hypothetical protein
MKVEWTEKEKQLIGKLGSSQFKMRNPEDMTRRILLQIEGDSTRNRIRRWNDWIQIVAAAVVLLSITIWVAQEGYTSYSRLKMTTAFYGEVEKENQNKQCLKILRSYLKAGVLTAHLESGRTDTVYMFRADVDYLKDVYPQHRKKTDDFLEVIARYYPSEYANYLAGGALKLSIQELKYNQRLCNILN